MSKHPGIDRAFEVFEAQTAEALARIDQIGEKLLAAFDKSPKEKWGDTVVDYDAPGGYDLVYEAPDLHSRILAGEFGELEPEEPVQEELFEFPIIAELIAHADDDLEEEDLTYEEGEVVKLRVDVRQATTELLGEGETLGDILTELTKHFGYTRHSAHAVINATNPTFRTLCNLAGALRVTPGSLCAVLEAHTEFGSDSLAYPVRPLRS